MLPSERRDVAGHIQAHAGRALAEILQDSLQMPRVPQDDCRDDQIQSGGGVGLILEMARAEARAPPTCSAVARKP